MKRSFVAGTTLAIVTAFSFSASAAITWGGIRAWVKKQISPIVAEIKDPKVKEAIDGLRKEVNGLKGKLQGLYPQFRAITAYLAVAAVKSKEGSFKAEDLQALVEKIKEATTKIGKGGLAAVREWVAANKDKFQAAKPFFKVAFNKIGKEFKSKVHGWWKKMAAKLKAAAAKVLEGAAGSAAAPASAK